MEGDRAAADGDRIAGDRVRVVAVAMELLHPQTCQRLSATRLYSASVCGSIIMPTTIRGFRNTAGVRAPTSRSSNARRIDAVTPWEGLGIQVSLRHGRNLLRLVMLRPPAGGHSACTARLQLEGIAGTQLDPLASTTGMTVGWHNARGDH